MDLLIQGPIYPETLGYVEKYLFYPGVEQVILSCWDTDPEVTPQERLVVVRSKDVPNPGPGNRNRQIQTSHAGMQATKSKMVAKVRSDQLIHPEDFAAITKYYEQHNTKPNFGDLGSPVGQLAVFAVVYHPFAFFAFDQFFYGHREDMAALFDVPHSPETGAYNFFIHVITEAWLEAHYLAKYDSRVKAICDDWQNKLVMRGPGFAEALRVSNEILEKAFLKLPPVRSLWNKNFKGWQVMPKWHGTQISAQSWG